MNLKKLCLKYDIDVKGIIQVGASMGQELFEFWDLQPENILLFEPIPSCAEHLRILTKDKDNILVREVAISDVEGIAELNITNNLLSSSLLPLKLHKKVFQEVHQTKTIQVICQTLDTALSSTGLQAFDYNLLYIDVQGAEFLVLLGATETLQHIEAIHLEANYKEMYKGCILEPELTEFLQKMGFEKVKESPIKFHQNDVFYVRMH